MAPLFSSKDSPICLPQLCDTSKLLDIPSYDITDYRRSEDSSTCPPRDYADRVSSYASCKADNALYSGHHLDPLSRYSRSADESWTTESHKDSTQSDFALSYDFTMPPDERVKALRSPEEIAESAREACCATSQAQISFLRGHPTPDFVDAIGSAYNVDPEFFRQHLGEHALSGHHAYRTSSSPSSTMSMPRLHIMTVGFCRSSSGESCGEDKVTQLRHLNKKGAGEYMSRLRHNDSAWKLGSSYIRRLTVHDEDSFSMEQYMSICVNTTSNGWIAVVWTDTDDLHNGPVSEWLATSQEAGDELIWCDTVLPTPKNTPPRPTAELYGRATRSVRGGRPRYQNASRIPKDYGSELDTKTAINDPFYALNPLFRFSCCTQSQFLHMLETRADIELERAMSFDRGEIGMSNLLSNVRALDRDSRNLQDIILAIQGQEQGDWPIMHHKDPAAIENTKASNAASNLLRDFRSLSCRAKDLRTLCGEGVKVISDRANIAESRRNIELAERVAWLTRLAFVFIPPSFICTFFGMNVLQLGTEGPDIWVWFAVAVPVSSVCALSMSGIPSRIIRARLWKQLRPYNTNDLEAQHYREEEKRPVTGLSWLRSYNGARRK